MDLIKGGFKMIWFIGICSGVALLLVLGLGFFFVRATLRNLNPYDRR